MRFLFLQSRGSYRGVHEKKERRDSYMIFVTESSMSQEKCQKWQRLCASTQLHPVQEPNHPMLGNVSAPAARHQKPDGPRQQAHQGELEASERHLGKDADTGLALLRDFLF